MTAATFKYFRRYYEIIDQTGSRSRSRRRRRRRICGRLFGSDRVLPWKLPLHARMLTCCDHLNAGGFQMAALAAFFSSLHKTLVAGVVLLIVLIVLVGLLTGQFIKL